MACRLSERRSAVGSPASVPAPAVALGEELLKSVYEALRASPAWNDTALLVVYDDPGGFYDHVPTPLYAPPPDAACDGGNSGCPDRFAFDRLGVRLANLLVSLKAPPRRFLRLKLAAQVGNRGPRWPKRRLHEHARSDTTVPHSSADREA